MLQEDVGQPERGDRSPMPGRAPELLGEPVPGDPALPPGWHASTLHLLAPADATIPEEPGREQEGGSFVVGSYQDPMHVATVASALGTRPALERGVASALDPRTTPEPHGQGCPGRLLAERPLHPWKGSAGPKDQHEPSLLRPAPLGQWTHPPGTAEDRHHRSATFQAQDQAHAHAHPQPSISTTSSPFHHPLYHPPDHGASSSAIARARHPGHTGDHSVLHSVHLSPRPGPAPVTTEADPAIHMQRIDSPPIPMARAQPHASPFVDPHSVGHRRYGDQDTRFAHEGIEVASDVDDSEEGEEEEEEELEAPESLRFASRPSWAHPGPGSASPAAVFAPIGAARPQRHPGSLGAGSYGRLGDLLSMFTRGPKRQARDRRPTSGSRPLSGFYPPSAQRSRGGPRAPLLPHQPHVHYQSLPGASYPGAPFPTGYRQRPGPPSPAPVVPAHVREPTNTTDSSLVDPAAWIWRLFRGSHKHPDDPTSDLNAAWMHVGNLDEFLARVYAYHRGKGFLCIVATRLTKLASILFIVWLCVFMTVCIDHAQVRRKSTLHDVIRPQCTQAIPHLPYFLLLLFGMWWVYQCLQLVMDLPRLLEMARFFKAVLGLAEQQVATVSWAEVTTRLANSYGSQPLSTATALPEWSPPPAGAVPAEGSHGPEARRRHHPLRRPLDAMQIANRLMRQENYMIAMFNKDNLLNLRLPYLGSRQMLTHVMEWTLKLCIFSFLFEQAVGEHGSVGRGGRLRKRVLREANRPALAWQLRRRFLVVGLLSLLVSPVLFTFLVVYFALKYTQEIHDDPSSLHARQFTPFARWRFREFNELDHVFQYRLAKAEGSADHYLAQFPPHPLLATLAKFLLFLAGSLASCLLFISLFDEDWSRGFEITPGRSVVFWLGILAVVVAVSRGMAGPVFLEDYQPHQAMRELAEHTHYLPAEWRAPHAEAGRVRGAFVLLYEYRALVLLQELLSVLSVPFILLFSLPANAEAIIDFFREFTVHVDGLGYVCSFALFDFARHGNVKYGGPGTAPLPSAMGKMEASFVSFSQQHPNWTPDLEGSKFLDAAIRRQQQLLQREHAQQGLGARNDEPGLEASVLPDQGQDPGTRARRPPCPDGAPNTVQTAGPSTAARATADSGQVPGPSRTWAALHERGPSAFQDSRMRESGVFRLVDDLLQLHDKLLRGGG